MFEITKQGSNMNYVIFNGTIDFDSVDTFIQETRAFKDEQLTIYLHSTGGDFDASSVLYDYINSWKKDVTIVAIGEIDSCALMIFLQSNSRKIVKACMAGHHIIGMDTNTREIKASAPFTKILCLSLDSTNSEYFKLLDMLEVPEIVQSKIKAGEDVYIDKKELEREAKVAERLLFRHKE